MAGLKRSRLAQSGYQLQILPVFSVKSYRSMADAQVRDRTVVEALSILLKRLSHDDMSFNLI